MRLILVMFTAFVVTSTVHASGDVEGAEAAFAFLKTRFLEVTSEATEKVQTDVHKLAGVRAPNELMMVYDKASNETRFVTAGVLAVVGPSIVHAFRYEMTGIFDTPHGLVELRKGKIVGRRDRTTHGIMQAFGYASAERPAPLKIVRRFDQFGKLARFTGWTFLTSGLVIAADAILTKDSETSRVIHLVNSLLEQVWSSVDIRTLAPGTLTAYYASPAGFPIFMQLNQEQARHMLGLSPELRSKAIQLASAIQQGETALALN